MNSEVLSRRKLLITVADGAAATAAGIELLWRTLARNGGPGINAWERLVVVPSWAWPLPTEHAFMAGQHTAVQVFQSRREDRYASKLVLKEFVSTLPNDTELLYLDYDHVCRAEYSPVCPPTNVIRVGSVTGIVSPSKCPAGPAEAERLGLLPDAMHYNTSLLHGLCGTLRRAMVDWEAAYENLQNLVDCRHLEEIAWSVAAVAAGVVVSPVSSREQASWDFTETEAPLFHYGGELDLAQSLKAALAEIALRRPSSDSDLAFLQESAMARWVIGQWEA
jgi:hypothetical protein